MKPIIPAFLLVLCAHSLSFGATNCQVVDYVDRSELICIGDEKASPDLTAPVATSRATIADYIAQNPVQSPAQDSNPGTSAVRSQPIALPSAATSTSPAVKSGSAAENLAKRRELATRNTRNLMNYSSAPTLPGQ